MALEMIPILNFILNLCGVVMKLIDPSFRFELKDLEREKNPRFSFSFLHPIIWDRSDPQNLDGNTYVNPNNTSVKMSVWGQYAVLSPTLNSWVSEILKDACAKPSFRNIQNVESGRHAIDTRKKDIESEGKRQIPGRKLKFKYKEDGKKITIVEFLTQFGNIQYCIKCEAPSRQFFVYDNLFLNLGSSLRVDDSSEEIREREEENRVLLQFYERLNSGPDNFTIIIDQKDPDLIICKRLVEMGKLESDGFNTFWLPGHGPNLAESQESGS